MSRQDKLTVSFIRGVVTKTGYEKWWLLMVALNELGEEAQVLASIVSGREISSIEYEAIL